MSFKNYIIVIILLSIVIGNNNSSSAFRKAGLHDANLVKTVFTNNGIIGLDKSNPTWPRAAWIYDTNGYFGDVSLLVGAEVTYNQDGLNKTFQSVVTCPVDRPRTGLDISSSGTWQTFQPVKGYYSNNQDFVAMSTKPSSWPETIWPDENCNWASEWCGYFGKDTQLIQQESFYVMNDNNDTEFNYSGENDSGHSYNPGNGLNGLGLEVKVRGMQWPQTLAQDCLFFLYEITNKSEYDYKKVVFGEVVGTYLGVTGYSDSQTEWNDDWSFFDVNSDMVYSGDFDNTITNNPSWVGDVGMVGFAFLESPGNPYDGIDNDGDCINCSPVLDETNFDSRIIQIGDYVITIDDEYRRNKVEIIESPQEIISQGETYTIRSGDSLVEGNEIEIDCNGITTYKINDNANNGLDDDLDGLIDENFYLHYYQKRFYYEYDTNGDCVGSAQLIDNLSPRAYVDYLSLNNNTNGYIDNNVYDLIDERRDDGIDNDGDWDSSLHDVGADGLADSGDFSDGEGNGIPDLGEPNFDSKDPDESDQIGLTSFDYFTPAEEFPMDRDDELWEKLSPGEFDVQETIVNGQPIAGEDGDFIFGSGYFPLKAGDTQRFSIALVYGADKDDLDRNRVTVQDIYDKEYKFPPPPEKPTLTAVAGNSEVALYWDRIAETKKDPVTGEYDFQGYKIYRATDPNFNDVRNITNGYGVIEAYVPIAQYDLYDDIASFFYPSYDALQLTGGLTFYLGDNTGLKHSYVDTDVINGRTYYYAVTAYDSGDSDSDLFPAENSKLITVLSSGEISTDINTAVVTPTSFSQGFDIPDIEIERLGNQYGGTGSISYEVVNPSHITGHSYLIDFLDSAGDNIDNDYDGEIDEEDLDELIYPVTTFYSVYDEMIITVPFELTIYDSELVNLGYDNIVAETFELYRYGELLNIVDDYEIMNTEAANEGKIRIVNADKIPGEFEAKFNYYPICNSPYMNGAKWSDDIDADMNELYNYEGTSLWVEAVAESEVFDGIRLNFKENYWEYQYTDEELDQEIDYNYNYKWMKDNNVDEDISVSLSYVDLNVDLLGFAGDTSCDIIDCSVQCNPLNQCTDNIIPAHTSSNDLRITFYDNCVDCTDIFGTPTNFKIDDITRGIENLEYLSGFIENNTISPNAQIYIFESFSHSDLTSINVEHSGFPVNSNFYSWFISFSDNANDINFGDEDVLEIYISKPFREGDQYLIETELPNINSSSDDIDLSNIKVVPNPYIATNALEPPLSTGVTSGRGERKIEFINLPDDAIIKIFNIRGQHITTLNHNGDIFDGSVSWNLRTKENMDIAYGVYLYVVESRFGVKKGKIAIIK